MPKDLMLKLAPYIMMIIMIIALIFIWNEMQKAKTELEIFKRSQGKIETVGDINNPLDTVMDREKNTYPKIDKNITSLNKSIELIDKQLDKLEKNKPTKEQSNEKFKNATFEEINRYYNSDSSTTTDNPSSS